MATSSVTLRPAQLVLSVIICLNSILKGESVPISIALDLLSLNFTEEVPFLPSKFITDSECGFAAASMALSSSIIMNAPVAPPSRHFLAQ